MFPNGIYLSQGIPGRSGLPRFDIVDRLIRLIDTR